MWTCKEALLGIRNRTHEWVYDALLQHAYYPITEGDTFITFYTRNLIRGLRMIYTKKYIGAGPIFCNYLEKSPELFNSILRNKSNTLKLSNYILEKTDNMKLKDFQTALGVTKVKKKNQILQRIEKFMIS